MTLFRYKAVTRSGEMRQGAMEAAAPGNVLHELRAQDLLPVRIEAQGRRALALDLKRGKAASRRLAIDLFRGLATLLNAGVVLDRALDLLARSADRRETRGLALGLRDRIHGGTGLATAIEASAAGFDPVATALIRAGEESGDLGPALDRVATVLERGQAQAERLRAALTYPLIVVAAAGAAMTIIATVVVPAFEPLFRTAGVALPTSLWILLSISRLLTDYGAVAAILLLALSLVGWRILQRPAVVRRYHAWLLRIPRLGRLLASADIARFARVLSALLDGGVALPTALTLARPAVRNSALAETIADANRHVRAGASLSTMFSDDGRMPPIVGHLLGVGEATGQPARMLARIADICEQEVQRSTEKLLALLVPGLTIALGVLVAGVVSVLLSAVLDINQVVF